MMGAMTTYDVVWPGSAQGIQRRRQADRLETLDGRRVAFLWDYLFRGDELFPLLEEELRRRHPGIDILPYDVVGNTHGGDEAEVMQALPRTLRDRGVDAVVSGMGC